MGINRTILLFTFCLFSIVLFGQNGYVRHTVQAGETLYSIAKTYQISEADLVKYNPDIAQGLKEGMVLILPKNAKETSEKPQAKSENFVYHTVEAKETIYGLCKKYNITEAQLLDANPDLKDGLKIGSTIVIPITEAETIGESVIVENPDYTYHVVEAKETVYSICKAAGITEDEFLDLNPGVRENGLQIGQTIRLPKSQVKEELPSDQPKTKEYGLYRVLEGDDLAAIAAKYNTTTEELLSLNPELVDGLVVGRYIVVPTKQKAIRPVVVPAKIDGMFWRVPDTNENLKLHFAVVLPLYLAENDSIKRMGSGYNDKIFDKSEAALQFLSGFLTAIDTLARLGYDIKIDIYDSKNDLDIVRSIARKIDRSVDAIIGPLYSTNAELMASMLPAIPVISPLSKTLENANRPNLVNCVSNQKSELLAMSRLIQSHPKSNVLFINSAKKANKEAVKAIKKTLYLEDTMRVKTVWTDGGFKREADLMRNLENGKQTLLFVVDQDPAFVSDLFTQLKNFRDSSVLIVTTSKVFEIKTLEYGYLNNQNFVGLSPEYTDYADTLTQLFIKKFRIKAATEPNKYGFSGYDTGLYFSQLIATHSGLPTSGTWPKVSGVNKGFNFESSSQGGAKNNFMYQLRIRDFELLETKQ